MLIKMTTDDPRLSLVMDVDGRVDDVESPIDRVIGLREHQHFALLDEVVTEVLEYADNDAYSGWYPVVLDVNDIVRTERNYVIREVTILDED